MSPSRHGGSSATLLLATQEPLIFGRLTVVGDDAECRRRGQTSVATSSPDRQPHHSGDRPQMVVYVRRLKTRLLGDALDAEEGSRNHLGNEAEIDAGVGTATDRTEQRIRRGEAAIPPTLDEGAGLGAESYQIGVERCGTTEKRGGIHRGDERRHGVLQLRATTPPRRYTGGSFRRASASSRSFSKRATSLWNSRLMRRASSRAYWLIFARWVCSWARWMRSRRSVAAFAMRAAISGEARATSYWTIRAAGRDIWDSVPGTYRLGVGCGESQMPGGQTPGCVNQRAQW